MLSDLNDDCLLQIFEFLSLKDQVDISEVCQHFKYLMIHYIWSRKYTDLQTQMRCLQPLTLQQYKTFFRSNAENIRRLRVEDTNNFVYVYNSNRLNERPDYTFYFGLKMINLKELNCPYARVHDGDIKILSENCPKLEYLYLGEGSISGKYIDDMNCLKLIKIGNKLIQMPMSMYEYEEIAF